MKKKTKSFQFQPFSLQQKRVLSWWADGSPFKNYDMVIAEGSIRAGKTISMIDSFFTWSLNEHKGQAFIIAGKSMGALKRNVLEPAFQILNHKGIPYNYNRSENYVEVGSNIYYCFGANNESSQDVLQGLTAAGCYADEVALMPRSFVDQMLGRCSVEGSKSFMNCNPGGPYHWFKLEFIDKAKEKMALVLHFTMDDNLTLSPQVKDRFKRMFSGVFYQRFILGLWVMAEGSVYDNFRKEDHTVKTIKRYYREYYVSCDYGTQNPMAFGLWGLHGGVWYKVKEYHYDGRKEKKQKTDVEYAQDLKKFLGPIKPRAIIVDPSATSFKAQLKQDRFFVMDAKNAVQEGISNMRTALSSGMIKYNDICEETFKEFASYAWDPKYAARGEDVPKKESDHQLDADRYFVNTILFKPKAVVSSKNAW